MTSARDQRIVVTGLGATTPLGGTITETWEGILAGRSGARTIDADWVTKYELPVTFAAQLAVPPSEVLARHQIKRLDPSAQYALIASRAAWEDAGKPEIDPERLGVVMGSGIGGVWTLLDQWDVLREKGPRRVYPLAVPMLMPNGPSAAVSLDLGARAGAHTPVSACASGAEGMAYAAEMIRSGRADVVVAGGTEAAIHALPIAGFAAMQALSTRNDEPTKASRPYDTGRDGFVLGEGAAVIVLESEEHAKARGAQIYAVLAGHRDVRRRAPHHRSRAERRRRVPGHEGGRRVGRPLAGRHLPHQRPRDVDPGRRRGGGQRHRPGVRRGPRRRHPRLGDQVDDRPPPGCGRRAGGVVHDPRGPRPVAPATINIDDLDPAIPLDVVRGEHRTLPDGDVAAMDNSFGFGGHNVALVFTNA